jgi:CarD family transcriptional regulator
LAVTKLAVPAPTGRCLFECAIRKVIMTTAKAPVVIAPAKKVPANSNKKLDFKANDHVVYPTHGVGKIMRIEEQEVAGTKLELFVITFDKDKMTLRVPTMKAKAVGMRKLSSPDTVATALNTLKGRARIKRTMWSRRAQEYEAKINSGDLVSIAEVVRDLHRASGQPEQSYSERQLYEAALARMAREVAAVEKIDENAAVKRVEGALLKKAA